MGLADIGNLSGIAFLKRQVLPRQNETGRAVLARQRVHPRCGRFDRVARPPDVHVGNQAQARRLFDRLVCRAVFAEANRIVREDKNIAQLHERRHPQGVARIIRERQEGAGFRNEAAVQCEPVGDRSHREFTHAEINDIAGAAARSFWFHSAPRFL